MLQLQNVRKTLTARATERCIQSGGDAASTHTALQSRKHRRRRCNHLVALSCIVLLVQTADEMVRPELSCLPDVMPRRAVAGIHERGAVAAEAAARREGQLLRRSKGHLLVERLQQAVGVPLCLLPFLLAANVHVGARPALLTARSSACACPPLLAVPTRPGSGPRQRRRGSSRTVTVERVR